MHDARSRFCSSMRVDLGKVAHTLTKALDYVGIDDRSHGRRVGLMCHRIAHILGWDRETRHFMLIAGMVHDCGVSSTAAHQKLVDELEWSGADVHCRRGSEFLEGFPPFARYAAAIRKHHTRWNEMPADLPADQAVYANLIFLADRFDVVLAGFKAEHPAHLALGRREDLLGQLAPYSGSLFSPDLFEALREALRKDSFLLELEDEFLDPAIFETLAGCDHALELDFNDILALGEMISQIVDAKSPFTHFHSLRVADLVYAVSGLLGYDQNSRETLRLAGLLHDIGKLRTPDEVLEKPGALDADERSQMARHPLDGKLVLAALFPNTPIAEWASLHHEELNGSGYPFGWTAERISREARLLTICDIFQALCQIRPYRGRLPASEVIAIMTGMRDAGEIDPELFRMVAANQDELYKIAVREGTICVL